MIFLVHIRFRLNIHASTKKLDFLDKRTSDESTLNVLKVNCKKNKQTIKLQMTERRHQAELWDSSRLCV